MISHLALASVALCAILHGGKTQEVQVSRSTLCGCEYSYNQLTSDQQYAVYNCAYQSGLSDVVDFSSCASRVKRHGGRGRGGGKRKGGKRGGRGRGSHGGRGGSHGRGSTPQPTQYPGAVTTYAPPAPQTPYPGDE